MKLLRPVAVMAAGLVAACLALPLAGAAQQTRADAEKDPVLKAMLEELDRNMSQLQLKGFAKPYFIQYRIEDVDNFKTAGLFGASEGSQWAHLRVFQVTVRVGDYKTDSSGVRGESTMQLAGTDNDLIALRSELWSATDRAYKNALAAYAQKQAALKQVQTPPQADDFSHEKPVIKLEEPAHLVLDEATWTDHVAQASGVYRTDPAVKTTEHEIQMSTAFFDARVMTTRLVNSEGTIVRKPEAAYEEAIVVGVQADDGMKLLRSYATSGASLKDLDTAEIFNRHAATLISTLSELRKAPLVGEEEYHGPILLSADAATDTLYNLLASGVGATRPPLGTEARTNGVFASSYHARVLPDFMTVVDDPELTSWNGKGLIGAYDVDDEGVPAQTVTVVEDGRLENYLVGREPVRDFPQSNGHGRAGFSGPAQPTISVMKVTAKDGLTDEALNHKLLAMAKDRELKSAYYLAAMGPGLTPRLLYRVTPDGKRELVRGAELDDLDQRALRSNVEAAGNSLWVTNYFGAIPQTMMAPALLLDDITVRRANAKNDKLPYYPPPE